MRFGWKTVEDANFETISKGYLRLRSYWFLSWHWVPSQSLLMVGSICESRLYDTTCFLLGVSSLCHHVDLVTTSLRAGSKSTSLSFGFCVHRPKQYDMICWELNLISGFFAFAWMIVWPDGINKFGGCLAKRRGY